MRLVPANDEGMEIFMEKTSLKVSYHREMKKNYLMIEAEELKDQRFEARMLVGNTIDGLLKFRIRRMDNSCQFCYEITSKQPLKRLLETRTVGERQLKTLLLGIARTLTRMEEYLLSEEQIILDSDFVYIDPEDFSPELCLMPGKKGDFPREFSDLLQELLDKVDHQDKDAVILIYGLYRESLKENYGLDDLLQWLTKEKYPDMDNGGKGEESEIIKENIQSSEIYREEDQERENRAQIRIYRQDVKFPYKQVLLCAMLVPGICAAIWLMKGPAAVYWLITKGILLVAGSIFISAGGVLYFVWRWRHTAIHDTETEDRVPADAGSSGENLNNSWQMVFSEDEQEVVVQPEEDDEDSHTVLLWSKGQDAMRRLVSEDGKSESISITYFPFLIGKQENLTDYTLDKDTVSRIHVKIDQKDENYFLTDLNSTNGTAVNGRKLENNETVNLKVGDQVVIADLYFLFQ